MTNKEAVIWLANVMADIGKAKHSDLWHYEQALSEIKEMLESQPQRKKGKWLVHGDVPKTCSCCHEDWDKLVNGDVWYTDELPKYCPNCGSYNGGKEDEID